SERGAAPRICHTDSERTSMAWMRDRRWGIWSQRTRWWGGVVLAESGLQPASSPVLHFLGWPLRFSGSIGPRPTSSRRERENWAYALLSERAARTSWKSSCAEVFYRYSWEPVLVSL